jgi:hypothetical protein
LLSHSPARIDLSPDPSPEREGSKTFSEFLGDISPKNSELKNFFPFLSGGWGVRSNVK